MVPMEMCIRDRLYGAVYHKLFTPRIGLAYSKIEYPDVHHVLNEVKQAGGIAVIAHPGQLKDISLLEQLADRKEIDGIEAVSYTHRAKEFRNTKVTVIPRTRTEKFYSSLFCPRFTAVSYTHLTLLIS